MIGCLLTGGCAMIGANVLAVVYQDPNWVWYAPQIPIQLAGFLIVVCLVCRLGILFCEPEFRKKCRRSNSFAVRFLGFCKHTEGMSTLRVYQRAAVFACKAREDTNIILQQYFLKCQVQRTQSDKTKKKER